MFSLISGCISEPRRCHPPSRPAPPLLSDASGSPEHPHTSPLPVHPLAVPQVSPSVPWPAVTLVSAPTKNAKPGTQRRQLVGGSPSTATIAPPQRQGGDRQRALQLRPRPPFPGSISFSPGPGEGKTGPRLLPPPTNAPGGLGTEVWEPAWWILDHTARPAAPLPREDAGRDPQRDPESWNH